MAGQAIVDDTRLEIQESEIDQTQKSNEEAYKSKRKSSESKPDPENRSTKQLYSDRKDITCRGNISANKKYPSNVNADVSDVNDNSLSSAKGSSDVRKEWHEWLKFKQHISFYWFAKFGVLIMCTSAKKSNTIEGLLGLREASESLASVEETDILQRTIALCSGKYEKRSKHFAKNNPKTRSKERKRAEWESKDMTKVQLISKDTKRIPPESEPIGDDSMSYMVQRPITPAVSIEGSEIVLKVTCIEPSNSIAAWTIILFVVPSIFNIVSAVSIVLTTVHIRSLQRITEGIASSTNWLIRTATRVSFGPTAKKALIGYARSKPHLAKYAQAPPTPTDCADPAPSLNFASTVQHSVH
ncbi:unnamed protein product [Toxocara canis]|uniref:MLO-like protein n=1 Tax=Toxocara canis TaxID=6265 RepID=A0A183UHT7_TOXCA|nr:unnamed protein product [Toxocara canis]